MTGVRRELFRCLLVLCHDSLSFHVTDSRWAEPREPHPLLSLPCPLPPDTLITADPPHCCFTCQPSPIKKERSPRPQSFCHSSSISPQDKLSLPGFGTPRDKQRLSYGAFTNQIFSASTDSPTSPIAEAPPLPPRNATKGTSLGTGRVTPSSELGTHPALRSESRGECEQQGCDVRAP